jgi:hypothetical protein
MKRLLFSALLLAGIADAQINGAGQLGCSGAPVTGSAWTSGTSVNATQALLTNVSAAAALVQLTQTTTLTGGAATFELSWDGGTSWTTASTAILLNPVTLATLTNPYTFQASTNIQYFIQLSGASNLRVRLSTVITGTGSVTPVTTAICGNPASTATISGTVSVAGVGTAGTPNANVETMQGITGGTPLPAQGSLGDNGTSGTTNRIGTLPAISQSVMPSAETAGRDAALRVDLHGNLFTASVPSGLATFGASKLGLVPAATPTDIAVLSGNASNTVIPIYVSVSCTQTTAGIVDIQLYVRTTADTSGTSTGSPSSIAYDQNNSAAVSSVLTYTANPTVNDGTNRPVDAQKLGVMAAATATPSDIYVWRPSMGQSVVLRGTAQQLAVNLNAVTLTGGSCSVVYRWIETTGL